MKSLLKSLLFGLVIALPFSTLSYAADRQWTVSMQDLQQTTTNKTLAITYSVLSTIDSDKFTVSLQQNSKTVLTHTIDNNEGGDSGVFKVTLPSAGTYTFQTVVNNAGDGSTKKSQQDTITLVEEPVVKTSNTVSTNSGASSSVPAAPTGGRGGSLHDSQTGGQVLAQSQNGIDSTNGETDSQITTETDQNSSSTSEPAKEEVEQEAQPVSEVATEQQQETEENGNNEIIWATVLAILAAGIGYAAYRYNPGSRE